MRSAVKSMLTVTILTTIILIGFLPPILTFSASAEEPKIWVYTKLPAAPEGVCVDSKKNLYATLHNTGEVVLVKNDGSFDHVAWVPSKEESGQGEIYGIETDKDDNLYVAYLQNSKYLDIHKDIPNVNHPACHDVRVTRSGVYKIDAKTRQVTAVATRGDGWPFCFPDDVAVDNSGNIYLTDLTYSGIWKISPDGKKVTMWSDDPLLGWQSDPILPLGVNALVLDKDQKHIYCDTTTLDGKIVKIPIKADGSADKAQPYSRGHAWFDGIEIDEEGYVYGSMPGANEIVIIPPSGYPGRIAIDSTLFQGPTSLALRDGILYTANLGYGLPYDQREKTIIAIRVKDFIKAKKK
jgi:sugar lactone lactonase YvrE